MKEDFIYYLWENRLLRSDLTTVDGAAVEVVLPGNRNYDSGPDYLNAKIRVSGTLWCGNVEIHVSASDWYKHKHHEDRGFDNVVLHVVYNADCMVGNIPTIEIKGKFNEYILGTYQSFIRSKQWIACERMLRSIQVFSMLSWCERLIVEKMELLVKDIERRLDINHYDWEETLYQRIMHYLGSKVNNEAFDRLAMVLPLRVLRKHADNRVQLESMMLGCAGFLEENFTDGYPALLKREFGVMKSKFNLLTMPVSYWKRFRMRPSSFPTLRLAQMATVIHKNDGMFSNIIDADNVDDIKTMFDVEMNDYWDNHFYFEKETARGCRKMGKDAINMLIINAVIPVMFCYGKYHDLEDIKCRALNYLEELERENNKVIRHFEGSGVVVENAKQSQALLHLYNKYCCRKRCLECAVFYVISSGNRSM